MGNSKRKVIFIGRAEKDLNQLPHHVSLLFREAIGQIVDGDEPDIVKGIKSKALSGIGGGGAAVMELICRHDTNTFRTIYTVKIGHDVYVLHCFMKKSKSGIGLPNADKELIERRLKIAREISRYGT
jgi:phage-related protein